MDNKAVLTRVTVIIGRCVGPLWPDRYYAIVCNTMGVVDRSADFATEADAREFATNTIKRHGWTEVERLY